MIFIYILIFLALALIAYLVSIRPNKKRNLDLLSEKLYAHRGLHNNKDKNPENSLLAFKKAIDKGYGIELDVQVTRDKVPLVFHDENLSRVCGVDGQIPRLDFEGLKDLRLFKTDESIPSLKEVLDLVDARVPLIIEIKNETKNIEEVVHIARLLDDYQGPYVIESFNPLLVSWYKKNRPHIIRGQLSTKYNIKTNSPLINIRNFLLMNFMINFKSKPDFIAFNHKHKNKISFRLCKYLYNPLTIAFTIKNQETLEKNLKDFDIFVFDSFIPNKDTR